MVAAAVVALMACFVDLKLQYPVDRKGLLRITGIAQTALLQSDGQHVDGGVHPIKEDSVARRIVVMEIGTLLVTGMASVAYLDCVIARRLGSAIEVWDEGGDSRTTAIGEFLRPVLLSATWGMVIYRTVQKHVYHMHLDTRPRVVKAAVMYLLVLTASELIDDVLEPLLRAEEFAEFVAYFGRGENFSHGTFLILLFFGPGHTMLLFRMFKEMLMTVFAHDGAHDRVDDDDDYADDEYGDMDDEGRSCLCRLGANPKRSLVRPPRKTWCSGMKMPGPLGIVLGLYALAAMIAADVIDQSELESGWLGGGAETIVGVGGSIILCTYMTFKLRPCELNLWSVMLCVPR